MSFLTATTVAASQLFEVFDSQQVTDDMMAKAARLFSEHYGVWGEGGRGKPGQRVRMSAARLREQVLPAGADGTLVTATIDGVYAAQVFGVQWLCEPDVASPDQQGLKEDDDDLNRHPVRVCWVTQLVVHRDYRERGLATHMLRVLRDHTAMFDESNREKNGVGVFGILSSQPASCWALARAVGGPGDIEPLFPSYLSFARAKARSIFAASPVPYVRDAKVGGSLFAAAPRDDIVPALERCWSAGGAVSVANTGFFVDHAEPHAALTRLRVRRGNRPFPLGDDLPAGHEFLLLVPQ